MKTLITTVAAVIFSITTTFAQSNHHIEFELDPLAYSLGGASGHVAYTFKNERIQLGYGQLTLPENMQNHENVSESFKAVSLKWDYFFGQKDASHGFFAGPTFDYLFLTYEDDLSNTYKEDQLSIGIRGGYKFDLFKNNNTLSGLYLTPWVGASMFTKPGDFQLGEESYDRKSFTFFPTVHLGWSF
jgi:hypothetical protein